MSNVSQFNYESPPASIGDCVQASKIERSTNSTSVTSLVNAAPAQKFVENIQFSQDNVNNGNSSTRGLFSHIDNFIMDKLMLHFSTALLYPVERDPNIKNCFNLIDLL